MNDIHFIIDEYPEGGFIARSLEFSIFTEANTLDDLSRQVRDAVQCHFEEGQAPRLIHLHFTRDEIVAARRV